MNVVENDEIVFVKVVGPVGRNKMVKSVNLLLFFLIPNVFVSIQLFFVSL